MSELVIGKIVKLSDKAQDDLDRKDWAAKTILDALAKKLDKSTEKGDKDKK